MMVVNTKTLKNNPALGKALTGAWYEIMDIMTKKDEKAKKALTYMASTSFSITRVNLSLKVGIVGRFA